MNRRALLITLGVLGGLIVAMVLNQPQRTTGANFLQPIGPLLPQAFAPPEFVLLDHAGDTIRNQDLHGAPAALFFGYTNCPDVCPITLSQMVRAREELDLTPEEFRIVFITMDPVRDTLEVLARFRQNLGGGVVTLWEEEAEVWRQAGALGIQAMKGPPIDPENPLSYLMEHTARTYLLDDSGDVVAAMDPMPPMETIREKMEAVMELVRER